MKKARKGFTLVELLIVIGIIGVLGAMGLIGGKEANNIATATKIVEDFHIISAAMEMYYADNKSKIDATAGAGASDTDKVDAATIKTALEAYIKKDASKIVAASPKPGQFLITVKAAAAAQGQTSATSLQWWLSYTLDDGESGVAKILANKANQENFMASDSATTTNSDNDTVPNTYVSGSTATTVYYQVL